MAGLRFDSGPATIDPDERILSDAELEQATREGQTVARNVQGRR